MAKVAMGEKRAGSAAIRERTVARKKKKGAPVHKAGASLL